MSLMKTFGGPQDRLNNFDSKTDEKVQDAQKRAEEAQEKKKADLKRKEMQAKLFQD